MADIEKCPECGAIITEEDIAEGYCPKCEFVFDVDEEDDLTKEFGKDENEKIEDAYDEEDEE